MADDIAVLGIKVLSDDIVKATKRLDKFEKEAKQADKSTKKLSGGFKLLGGAVAAISFGLIIKNVVSTAAAFEKLEASLETVTGSTENATMAMEGITAFATSTPFQVGEITESFIKLKALGIEPTEEKLRSFGNTSSAMGKSLNQMIEAVADAATGEFERLKEFGIKSSSQGDQVAFTFNGITKTVGKNSEEITKYLTDIGNTKFAGAMEKQMDTLNGAFSNFGDTVELAMVKLAKESGFNKLLKEATLGVSLFIRELTGTQSAFDFKEKIKDINVEIKEQEAALKKLNEGKSWANLWTTSKVETKLAKENLVELRAELAELTKSKTDAEAKSKGALDAAGKRSPEEEKAYQQKIKDAIFEAESEKLFRQIEIDDQKLMAKLAFNEKMLAAEMGYRDRLYNLEAGSQQAALDFAHAIDQGKMKDALATGKVMLANEAKYSKEAFEIQKAMALADAAVNLPDAVIKSFNNGGGYPWGLVPAGLMAAAGARQISSIASTTFGSKPTISGVGGGGGSTSPSAPVASGLPSGSTALPDGSERRGGTTTIVLSGEDATHISIPQMENIFDYLGDAIERGDRIMFSSESRQALELNQ